MRLSALTVCTAGLLAWAPASPGATGIRAAAHAPAQPRDGEAVRVGARVTGTERVKTVTLYYQAVLPGQYVRKTDEAYVKNWTALPMRDDGREGDVTAGDHVYTAMIPAAVQTHRALIRYLVKVEDTAGQIVRFPTADDAVPNLAYFVWHGAPGWEGASQPGQTPVISFPPTLMTTLPSLTLIANGSDVEHSQWDSGWNKRRVPGTIVADGQVYDHILFHNRGQGSTYNTGKNKWGFKFPKGHEYAARDMWGRPFQKRWDNFGVNACASPWVVTNRGMAGLDEAISFRTYELAGVPSPRTIPTQFRVISSEAEANPKNQYEGDLWGLYLQIEDPAGDFLDERALPDGNVYRAAGGGDKKHQGRDAPPDNRDFDEFEAKSSGKQTEEWWRANLNLPAFYSFQAINRLIGNVDLRERENHYLYHAPDGRWTVIPWDLDMMFIPKSHQSGRVDQGRCLELPALRIEYGNRCRELLDLLAADASPYGGQFGQIVDEYAAAVHPAGWANAWPELDMCRWNYSPRTSSKGSFYRNPATGGPDGNWKRILATPDFAGFAKFVTDFATPSRPAEQPWKLNDGEPKGYGYGYLAAEGADPEAPERPTLHATGPTLHCSAYVGKNPFAAMQFRIATLAPLNAPPRLPRPYEINAAWTSPELTVFTDAYRFPPEAAPTGPRYRWRVRVKDTTGRWSRWSEAGP